MRGDLSQDDARDGKNLALIVESPLWLCPRGDACVSLNAARAIAQTVDAKIICRFLVMPPSKGRSEDHT